MNAFIEIKSNSNFVVKYNNYESQINQNFSIILSDPDLIHLKGKLLFFLSSIKFELLNENDKMNLNDIKLEVYELINYFANNSFDIKKYEKEYITITFVRE